MSYALDFVSETIPATELRWPGASAEQLDFMRAVYEAHVARSSARHPFVPDVPAAELGPIEGRFVARTAAATACQRLLAAARAAIEGQGLRVTVGLTSAYRPASQQLSIWQDNFPTYYQETRALRRGLAGGEHGPAAGQQLVAYVGQRVGAPGFSNHNNGDAVDLGVQENGARILNRTQPEHTARWRRTWFWGWLTTNAARFDFYQNTHIDEPWHWEHRPRAAAAEAYTSEAHAFESYASNTDAEDAADVATELLQAAQAGRLSLGHVRQQLAQLAQTGSIAIGQTGDTVTPAPGLLALLQALLAATPLPDSGRPAPFGILSLVRPAASYHTRGRAVDISRFAGFDIVMTNPAHALQGVLAVLAALPAGTYALGLPRPVRADATGARADHARYGYLRLYQGTPPALKPEYADLPGQNVFLPVNGPADIYRSPSRGNIDRDLDFIVEAAAQAQLRAAVAAARQRGARVSYLFPDALDHLHVQVLT